MPRDIQVDQPLMDLLVSLVENRLDFDVQIDRPADLRLFLTVHLPAHVSFSKVGKIQEHVEEHEGLTKMEEGKLTLIWSFGRTSDEEG